MVAILSEINKYNIVKMGTVRSVRKRAKIHMKTTGLMVTKRKITNNVDDEFNVKWKTPLCIVILFLNMDNPNIIQNEQ